MANEEKQLSQLAAFADLFNRLLDPTFLLDPATLEILEANDSAERTLIEEGATPLAGSQFPLLLDAALREDFCKQMRVAMRRYHPRQFESTIRFNGKTMLVEISACPLKLSDEREILQVITRDITAKRESELKIQTLLGELQSANKRLEILSTTDEMTGLFNFRHFKQLLNTEHARAVRYLSPYAVIFFDMDNFKHYNDRNGHPAGDDLLRKLAALIRSQVRMNDIPVRYGGEEMVVLCPEIDYNGAMVVAERIRKALAASDFPHAKAQPLGCLSVSVGVASYPHDGTEADAVLKAADNAMYYSKTHGRNQAHSAEAVRQICEKTGEKLEKKAA